MVDINPADVLLHGLEVSSLQNREIRDGDWDVECEDYEKFFPFMAIKHVCVDGGEWKDTEHYKRNIAQIDNGASKWDCQTKGQFDQRMANLEAIYADMRDNGFRNVDSNDMVGININRHGQLMFNNGRHRLSMAKLIGIPSIPVQISLVHKQWDDFKKSIKAFANSRNGTYQALTHPDLQDIPYHWGNDRVDAVKDCMEVKSGRLLDIGANWGQQSEAFARMGFDVTAAECDKTAVAYIKRLRNASPVSFEVYEGDVLELKDLNFEVVLAFNIFHHFIKSESIHHRFVDFLGRLDSKEMYFQAHSPGEGQMKGAYRNYSQEEFASFIVEHSCYTKFEKTEYKNEGRPIFKLSRDKEKKTLFVVGSGIGNQAETMPAFIKAKRKYGNDLVVVNSFDYAMEATEVLFEELAEVKRVSEVDPAEFDRQIVTYLAYDYPIKGIPVASRDVPRHGISEVEYNMRATGLDWEDADLSNFGGSMDSIEPMDNAPDVIIHDGYNKSQVVGENQWEAKSYPRWAEVVVELKAKGFTVGCIGIQDEKVDGAVDLTGIPFRESVAAIKGAKVVLCNDTGTYHVANLLGIPNVVVFTFTDTTKNYDSRFHKHSAIVRKDLDCSPCQFTRKDAYFWMLNKNVCKWECRDIEPSEIVEKALSSLRPNLFFGITTYNRLAFLQRAVISWDSTRRKDVKWTLAIADDGSTDGTLEWLDDLEIPDVDIVLFKNNRVGVHKQTNQMLMLAHDKGFDFGFKMDDDVEFLTSGWDIAYEEAARRTGFDHLIMFDTDWFKRHVGKRNFQDVHRDGLHGIVNVGKCFGAFWTFTPRVLEKVGFFDEVAFGKSGWGHVDYSWRCARAGFNEESPCFDIEDRTKYLRLISDKYKSAISLREKFDSSNTPAEEEAKFVKMKEHRTYIGPPGALTRPVIPEVSVVIPCYNYAHFLRKSVLSAITQTVNLEVIVVNDGSTDDTSGVVKVLQAEYPGRIKLVEQENQGLPGARNTGFEAATADWVFTLDADDALGQPDLLEKCLAKTSEDIGVVYLDLFSLKDNAVQSMNLDEKLMRKHNTIPACALIKKKVWEECGGYSDEMKVGCEDWEIWISCLEKGVKFVKCDDVYVNVDDVHAGRMSPAMQAAYPELLDKVTELHPEFFGVTPRAPRKEVSVIISSYNQRRELELCLESMKHQTALPSEVIVADDGSTDGTLEWLDTVEYPFPVRYVTRLHSWYRLASINNLAAKHGTKRRFLFTNADVLHCPDSLALHGELGNEIIGGGLILSIKQEIAEQIRIDDVAKFQLISSMWQESPGLRNNLGYVKENSILGVWGGNFSISREIFKRLGSYDEGYDIGWGGEESDLVRRSLGAGNHIQWLKGAMAVHLDHPLRAYAYSQSGSKKYVEG